MSEQAETISNIVELQTGEKINFGKSGKVVALYDNDSGEITFKVITGEVIAFNVNEIPADVLKEAAIYGLREKIKSTLSPIKAVITEEEAKEGKLNVASKIRLEIESLKDGKFVTRTADTGGVELDDFMKAFALVNATGKVNTGNGTFDVPAIGLSVTELKPNWVNVGDVAVVSEVLDYWAKLSKEDKSKQRKNTFVNTQASLITAGVVRGWRVK